MKLWFLLPVLLFACTTIQQVVPKEDTVVNFQNIKDPILYPSVKIITSKGMGSGTIIGSTKTGNSLTRYFILTAKHVIDDDAKASDSFVKIEVFDFIGHSDTYKAGYYMLSEHIDAAVLYVDVDIPLSVAQIADLDSKIYTPIYIVSCQEAQYITLNTGFITSEFNTGTLSRSRYTIFSNISFGSSGGGVFDANTHKLIAMVTNLSGSSQNTVLSYYIYALKMTELKKWLESIHVLGEVIHA